MKETRDVFSVPVQIARTVIRHYVTTGGLEGLSALPVLDMPPAGCFVSMKKHGELRGCIGTIAATRPTLVEEIVRNAVATSTEDPRFEPVTADELDELDVSVDVLGPSEPVSSRAELDPSVYGVIVTSGYRRGLLLPDLGGVDSVDAQLAIACRKGGILPDEPFRIERFRVTRYT
jgi:AmmeMemoRadiSam system protein A